MDGPWNSVDDFDGLEFRWFGVSSVPTTRLNVSFLVGDYSMCSFRWHEFSIRFFRNSGRIRLFPFWFSMTAASRCPFLENRNVSDL